MTTQTTTKPRPFFEHRTCTRCGGCGRYSYNAMHGSVCYGCSGSGWQLTKRGAAAQEFYRKSCMVLLTSIQVGDVIECTGVTNGGGVYRYFAKVTEVGADSGARYLDHATGEWADYYTVRTSHPKFGESGESGFPSTMVRKGQTAEEKRAKLDAAKAYEATLNGHGKPAKKRGA